MKKKIVYESNKAHVSTDGKKVPVKRVLVTEIENIFRENNDKCANRRNKRVGHLTQEKRLSVISTFTADLYLLGFRLEKFANLREKHIQAWVDFMVKNNQQPATIQNKLSVLRIFCSWVGKKGMVKSPECYVVDPTRVKRSTATKIDKSWPDEKIKILIEIVIEIDEIVGLQLQLCDAFGLRRTEAIMLKPIVADEGETLHVRWGTKGGRPRMVPIVNEYQRAVLDKAKSMCDPKKGVVCRPGKTLEQAINRFKYIMSSCGITKKLEGVVAHGLRHGYVHRRYEERTGGAKLPIKGGTPGQIDKQLDKVAKLKIMEELGHSRESVTTAYGGTFGHEARKKTVYQPLSEKGYENMCYFMEQAFKNGFMSMSEDEDKPL